ncbi:hypothetical protein FSARC_8200 [Fusarium sarcochroum]|uniref:Uncharacterized protein n=1 Tax=Fusarium sarcochroum TaxID=1208366 RepID=A0A8H4TTI8_9HYPO|nr:hypothetical protein FSARC_8200 [Fusarium sarcochroum]
MFGARFLASPATAVQAEPPQRPEALQNQGTLPAFRGVVQRVRAATVEWTTEWSQTDEWAKRYGSRVKVVTSTENEPLVDTLKEETGEDFDEVSPFFESYPSSRLLERQARYVKGFCGDATLLLENTVSGDLGQVQQSHASEPSAWVSDRDWYPQEPEDPPVPNKSYGRVLNGKDLWAVLQKKRFPKNGNDEETGPPRRIYINKPNGSSILALLRTTPPSQVPGFQELLANYITEAPTPVIRSREIFWWGAMCFLFSFNLPFFVICTQPQRDTRTLFNGKRPLRRRHDLSFLHLGDHEQDYYDEEESFQNETFLLEAVCSIMVTGRSDRYWTAACLDDDFFDSTDDQRLPPEEDIQHVDGGTDPIILKEENKIVSPRAYALAALASALTKIADYHKDIQDRFGTSLNHHTSTSWHGSPENVSSDQMQDWRKRYPEVLDWVIHYNTRIIEKLEHFLSHHLMLSPEGLPQHPLWQSVHKEERVTQILTDIRDRLDSLRDIDTEFRRFWKSCTEARRERKSEYQDEQVTREKKIQKITFAGFVLGILNLVAQIYAGRPEKINVFSSPGFMILTWGSFLLCFVICLIPFWATVSKYLAKLGSGLLKLSSWISRVSREQLNCLKEFLGVGKHLLVSIWGLFSTALGDSRLLREAIIDADDVTSRLIAAD